MNTYITTAIDYVNGKPHVGHAVEKVQADALARYFRLSGDDTFFLTGTDENALKNVQSAEKEGIPVKDLVKRNSDAFYELKDLLDLSFNDFIRTAGDTHKHSEGASKLWEACDKSGDIEKKEYKGLYCVGCEEFKKEGDLVDGKCPEHDSEPEKVEEENYFFKLSKYSKDLKSKIDSGELKIVPEFRKNEVLALIEQGLEDFSVSRSTERAKGWGIPVPGNDSQVMYVWFDALSNYINGLGYAEDSEDFKKRWLEGDRIVHVIGKGILRFHAVYWPAMLMSAGIFPKNGLTIYVHEYLSINGKKISKSLGNVIEPKELVDIFGTEATRYLLLSSLPYTSDGDITIERLKERHNSDLANNLGNLVSRVIAMSKKYFDKKTPAEGKIDGDIKSQISNLKSQISEKMEVMNIYESLQLIWKFLDKLNEYVEEKKPWELAKDEGNKEELANVLATLLQLCLNVADLIEPYLPETSKSIKKQIPNTDGELELGKAFGETKALFPRIEPKT